MLVDSWSVILLRPLWTWFLALCSLQHFCTHLYTNYNAIVSVSVTFNINIFIEFTSVMKLSPSFHWKKIFYVMCRESKLTDWEATLFYNTNGLSFVNKNRLEKELKLWNIFFFPGIMFSAIFIPSFPVLLFNQNWF